MSRPPLTLLPLAVVLGLTPAALALLVQYGPQEELGPAKAATGAVAAGPEAAFRLSPHRRYWRTSGWSGFGASRDEVLGGFSGDVDAANAALKAFVALPAGKKEVWLFPAPGSVRSADGKQFHPCDWAVHWVRHSQWKERTESHDAVLTLFVTRAGPIAAPDPRAGRWVKELDDDSYRVREAAAQALAGLGDAALPALREGLDQAPTPEQRLRIKRLLDRLRPIHLSRLKLPGGVRVLSLDRLVAVELRNWRSGDLGRSWQAATRLAEWAEYSEDALPPLVEALRDQREQVRNLARGAFDRLGKRAEGVLARLRAADGRETRFPDDVRKAIQAVASGEGVPGSADHWRENRRLRTAIAEFCHAASERAPGVGGLAPAPRG